MGGEKTGRGKGRRREEEDEEGAGGKQDFRFFLLPVERG